MCFYLSNICLNITSFTVKKCHSPEKEKKNTIYCLSAQVYGSRGPGWLHKHETLWVFQASWHLRHGPGLLGDRQPLLYGRWGSNERGGDSLAERRGGWQITGGVIDEWSERELIMEILTYHYLHKMERRCMTDWCIHAACLPPECKAILTPCLSVRHPWGLPTALLWPGSVRSFSGGDEEGGLWAEASAQHSQPLAELWGRTSVTVSESCSLFKMLVVYWALLFSNSFPT